MIIMERKAEFGIPRIIVTHGMGSVVSLTTSTGPANDEPGVEQPEDQLKRTTA